MFIRSEQEENYRRYVAANVDMAYDPGSGKSEEDRAQIVHGLQQANSEAVLEDPGNKESYDQAKLGSNRFAEMLMKEEGAVKNLLAQENTDQNLAHHGVTVSTLAIHIAKATGVTDAKKLGMIALAGLVHDVGHIGSELNISRSLKELSKDEMSKYREHPMEGARRVNEKAHFDQEVIKVIMEHEELINGAGFPNKLIEKKMHPFSVYVGCANALDRMVTFERTPLPDAIKRMLMEKIGLYPLPYLNSLKKLV